MRRRPLALALFGVLAIAGSASASAPVTYLGQEIDFYSAPEGPASAFSGLQHQSALTPFQITFTTRARRIGSIAFGGRNHVLLVAPTKDGGFCKQLSGPYGGTGCPITGKIRQTKGVLDPGMTGDASGPILFDGFFTVTHVARLQVMYQDRTTSTIPFTWVSSPIRAGFFLYDLSAHRRPGHRPIALSLFDGHGKQLYRERLSA